MSFPALSRRNWLGLSAAGCACLAAETGAARADAPAALPAGYTPLGIPLARGQAPGLHSRVISGSVGTSRIYAVVLGKGDEVLSGLTELAERNNLRASHFTAIGAFGSSLFGWFDHERHAYRNIPVDQQAEVVSLTGNISLVEGKPFVHIHGVVSLPDGTTRGGHLLHASVWPTLEVFLTEAPHPLSRVKDPETGLSLINPEA